MIDQNKKISLQEVVMTVVGIVISAAAYGLFFIPNDIVGGGLAGVAVIVNNLFPAIAHSAVVAVLSIFFFILGWIFLGKRFALKTLFVTILFPMVIFIVEQMTFLQEEIAKSVTDLWVLAIIGSVLAGLGFALVFKAGGSTGGFDISAFIGARVLHIQFTTIALVQDILVILLGIFIVGVQPALIGIINAFVIKLVIDYVFLGGNTTVLVQIITAKDEQIRDFIHNELDRGSTIINCFGGYSGSQQKMIQVLINKREYTKLKEKIKQVDEGAFVVIIGAMEVLGNGFKQWHE